MSSFFIRPHFAPSVTEVHHGHGLLKNGVRIFLKTLQGKVVIVADAAVKHHAEYLARQINAELVFLPGGEKTKSQENVTFLLDELFKRGAGKDATLVAMGGGSITDLAGFAASIYKRGITLVMIPTTLLGCVDAAIGGKTGIDHACGKNLIGSIYHPKAIFIDFDLLSSLPKQEMQNGYAEILKMGLIKDASIWESHAFDKIDPELILKAMQGKIAIVQQDPYENGLRRILNFGHTIGHALEKVSGYEMPHGEAIALGSLVESYLSKELCYLSDQDFQKIKKVYTKFPLKLPLNYSRQALLDVMAHDKKSIGGAVRFVLIDQIGHALPFDGAYCKAISFEVLASTLSWMESL